MKKKILVLGMNGFIGQSVIRFFKTLDFFTIGISKVSGSEISEKPEIPFYFRLPSRELDGILKEYEPEIVVNASGKASVDFSMNHPVDDFMENNSVTVSVLNSIREFSPKSKFVYLSSASVYGNPLSLPVSENHLINPISPYGYHKFFGEKLCEEFFRIYGIQAIAFRIFSAYGEGLTKQIIWEICNQISKSKSLTLKGTGNESRDFIHIEDICRAIYFFYLEDLFNGEVYNLASGSEITVKELSLRLIHLFKLNIQPTFSNLEHKGNPLNWRADMNKINKLGFQCEVDIQEGLSRYTQWFNRNKLN